MIAKQPGAGDWGNNKVQCRTESVPSHLSEAPWAFAIIKWTSGSCWRFAETGSVKLLGSVGKGDPSCPGCVQSERLELTSNPAKIQQKMETTKFRHLHVGFYMWAGCLNSCFSLWVETCQHNSWKWRFGSSSHTKEHGDTPISEGGCESSLSFFFCGENWQQLYSEVAKYIKLNTRSVKLMSANQD